MHMASPDIENPAGARHRITGLAGELQRLPIRIGPSPWPGYEHVRGFFIAESHAVLDGVDLGAPTRVAENPRIGELPLPARPAFAVGQGFWVIKDEEEYRRTREEVRRVMKRGTNDD